MLPSPYSAHSLDKPWTNPARLSVQLEEFTIRLASLELEKSPTTDRSCQWRIKTELALLITTDIVPTGNYGW